MICFIVTAGNGYTLQALVDPKKRVRDLPIQVWTYTRLFAADSLPSATYVFCDIERLAVWEHRLAGEVARILRAAGPGFRVVNDPPRVAARYELLLRLHAAGFNKFRAWRAEDGIPPARFPVFLRIESNHWAPLTDLIETPEALEEMIERLQGNGVPKRGLIIIEYQAEPLVEGVFRKFAAYRIGDRIVADHLVHDVTWLAKYGHADARSVERWEDERRFVRDNPHATELMKAFEIAGIEFGRADYGLVDGEVQIWEINTNPTIPSGNPDKVPPEKVEATVLARENRLDAIAALDTPSHGIKVKLETKLLEQHRKRQNPKIPEVIRE